MAVKERLYPLLAVPVIAEARSHIIQFPLKTNESEEERIQEEAAFVEVFNRFSDEGVIRVMRRRLSHLDHFKPRLELYLPNETKGPVLSLRWEPKQVKHVKIYGDAPFYNSKGVAIQLTEKDEFMIKHTVGSSGEGRDRIPAGWAAFSRHREIDGAFVQKLKEAEWMSSRSYDFRGKHGLSELYGQGKQVLFKKNNTVLLK